MASIKVAVRVRPPNRRENDMNSSLIINMEGDSTTITNIRLPIGANDTLGRERVKKFTFDHSYWSVNDEDDHYASQALLFDDLGRDVVTSAYDGYNACVFAYGQTGSGKTFTMMGSEDDPGLIPRICEQLFREMKDTDTTYRTEVSYLEIYNERVRDLLREKPAKHAHLLQMNLKVREHPKEGPYVQDLSKHIVMNYGDINELIMKGNAQRTTASTNMNDLSSRSHAIFTIVFTQATFKDDIPSEVHSKIHLVDLAGSERADSSGATGERLKEGGSINKSLVTLGNVISTLADLSEKGMTPKKGTFIPYRDSVLTWLLKDSLGGNAKTIMIATVSPADCNYAETLSTLRYANRAKRIINKPTVNEDPNVRLIRELREENAKLKALLGEMGDMGSAVKTREKLSRNEEKVRVLTEKWADKWLEAANVLEEHKTLALRKEGRGVVLDSELPYLLAIDDHVLSTGMKLYHLREGDTTIGREDAGREQDIVLVGPYIEAEHCIIRNRTTEVTLIPREGAMCSVNNVRAHEASPLKQGSLIRLGRHHIFRFNHPIEAAKLRAEMHQNGDGSGELVKVWEDFQWRWSMLSMTDSAVSDLETPEHDKSCTEQELEKLEERRREIEALEKAHLEKEGERLAELAKQEATRRKLEVKEQELELLTREAHSIKKKAEEAQSEVLALTQAFEDQVEGQLREQEKFEQEQRKLKEEREKLERDKQRAKEERARIRRERAEQAEKERLRKEKEREEWETVQKERETMRREQEEEEEKTKKRKAQMDKALEIEKMTYSESMSNMRKFVEQQVNDMREMIGFDGFDVENEARWEGEPDEMGLDLQNESLFENEAGDSRNEAGVQTTSEECDLDRLKLNLHPTLPAIPAHYLSQSTSTENLEEAVSCLELEDKPVSEWDSADISHKLTTLCDQVTDIRYKVCQALERKYNSLLSIDDRTHGLGEEVILTFSAIKPLFEELEKLTQLETCTEDVHDKLQEYDRILNTVDHFIQIHQGITSVNKSISSKNFLKALSSLEVVQNLMSSIDIEGDDEDRVYKVFKTELCIVREKLLYELSETWNKLLKWSFPTESKRLANKPRTITFEMTGVEQGLSVLTSTVQAMFKLSMLDSRLKTLCDRLMQYFVEPVVCDRATMLQVIDETEKYICVVLNPPGVASKAVPPKEVFQKLDEIFTFVHQPLSQVIVKSSELKEESKQLVPNVNLVQKIGAVIGKNLFECIYNECLCHVVPKSSKQFSQFNEVVHLTEQFQNKLLELKFMCNDEATLMDQLNNVNTLFANVRGQEIMKQAHEMMTQNFSVCVQISSAQPVGLLGSGDPGDSLDLFVKECRDKVGTTNFKLPTCKVSVPVRNIIVLSYNTLKDAFSSSQDSGLHMYNSVSNMFELFCDMMPIWHQEKATKSPYLAGLHHNNCMFVAHNLITVDKTFRQRLSPIPANRDPQLGDMVARIRKLGNEAFTHHINKQRKRLLKHLPEDVFECIADDEGSSAQKAMSQILDDLQDTSAVLADVLPANVYYKAMGTLFNYVLREIIKSVIEIEEFSSEDCDYLLLVLSNIQERGPVYFKLDPSLNPQVLLHDHVPDWLKLKELIIVLNSGLQDVADRWADGKGPLALHLTSEEVRRLVIAMFENTSNRDELLRQLRRPSVHRD